MEMYQLKQIHSEAKIRKCLRQAIFGVPQNAIRTIKQCIDAYRVQKPTNS